MILKNILIVDHLNGEAGKYHFEDGANLLISKTNSQGKSSLVKSVYYGLGFKINSFPKNWNPSQMAIKLELLNEETGEDIIIVRVKNLFYVTGEVNALTLTEYTHWLSTQLNIDMKLTFKSSDMISSVMHPSAIILPFYVDQDDSWNGRLYSSTDEIGMYKQTPERIIDYVLGISDDKDQELKAKLSDLAAKYGAIESKRDSINEVYMNYVNEIEPDEKSDITEIFDIEVKNRKSVDRLMALMDAANKKYLEYKATRIKLQREIDLKQKAIQEYQSVLKMHEEDYNFIKTVCKHCKSELTPKQVETRMNISSNIYELKFLIGTLEQEVLGKQSSVMSLDSDENNAHQEYLELSNEVQSNSEIKSVAELVDSAAKKKSQEEFASILQKLERDMSDAQVVIKEAKKEQKEYQKLSLGLLDQVAKKYEEYVTNISMIMSGSNVSNIDFKNFTRPKSSGVDVNQIYLGQYLAYMRLVSEFGRYQLPMCIDSFIKNETDDPNTGKMFKATEAYLLDTKGQSILTVIESNVERFMSSDKNYNKVVLGDKLLSTEEFNSAVAEVSKIVKL